MTIEPSQARTVCIRAVLPPKPAPVTLSPKMTPQEDAKLIRQRTHRAWGFSTPATASEDANAARKAAADARREDVARKSMAILARGPASSPALRDTLGISQNLVSSALGLLRAKGLADFTRKGRGSIWHINTEERQGWASTTAT